MALILKIENALLAALAAPVSIEDQDDIAAEADTLNQLDEICANFNGDVHYTRLLRQLAVLRDTCRDKPMKTDRDICTCLTSCYPTLHEVFSEVSTLTRLFLVIPATSATAERSFSTMRRLKTYLRSTMTTERLNSVMVLNVHKDMLDKLDDATTVNEFVAHNERRTAIFGSGRPA
jgi:hAT family C-terminal dimerisation region